MRSDPSVKDVPYTAVVEILASRTGSDCLGIFLQPLLDVEIHTSRVGSDNLDSDLLTQLEVEIPTSRVGSDTAGPDPRRVHRVEIPGYHAFLPEGHQKGRH